MGVMYTRPSRSTYTPPSPEDRRRQEEARKRREEARKREKKRKARERRQNAVRVLFFLANIATIVIMVSPLFAVVGFLASVGTGVVLIIVMVISYRSVNKAVSANPIWGLVVATGIVGIVIFVGSATIHTVFPTTMPLIDIATTPAGANTARVSLIKQSPYLRNSTVIYPYQVGSRFFFHISDDLGTRQVEIPQNQFMNFGERLWQNLGGNVEVDLAERLSTRTEQLLEIVSEEKLGTSRDTVFILDGDVPTVNFQQMFPDKLVLRSVSMDEGLILGHLEELYTALPLTPDDTVIINGVPNNPSELGRVQLQESDWEQWDGIHQAWNNAANKSGFTVSGNTAQEALNAFETSSNIVVVIAHSDGYSIFFPDGSSLSIDDVSSVQDSIKENNPLVVLFSCETARVDESLVSFAEELVGLGAKAVVAPISTIGARSSSALLESFLEASTEGLSPIEALTKAIQETNNTSLETWVAMLLEPKGKEDTQ
jgi:hypothetical protein